MTAVRVTSSTARAFGVKAGARRSKYGAIKTKLDGYTFDSRAESRRYADLALLKSAGQIWQLEVHPRYPLTVNGHIICVYEGDFLYRTTLKSDDGKNEIIGAQVCEDVKGTRTKDYIIKAKLFRALYPHIHFVEVKAK